MSPVSRARTAREQRRALVIMGVVFISLMFGVDVIGRSGMAEGIPILGWETPGPLTAGWLAVRLVKYSFTAVFFVVVMRFSLPDRQASDEQERPPGHAEKTGNT